MKNNIHTILCWLSLISILVSIATLCIFGVRIEPFKFTNDAVIGTMATLIGVCATVMVGWQIFSSMQVRGELKEIRELNDELKITTEVQEKKLEVEKNKREKQNKIFDAKISFANALALGQSQLLSSYCFFVISAKNYLELGDFGSCYGAIGNLTVNISKMNEIITFVNNGGDRRELIKIDYKTNKARQLDNLAESPIEEIKKLPNYSVIQEKIESYEAQRKKIIEKAKELREAKPTVVSPTKKE